MIKNSAESPPISADEQPGFYCLTIVKIIWLQILILNSCFFDPTFCSAQRISRVKSHFFFFHAANNSKLQIVDGL